MPEWGTNALLGAAIVAIGGSYVWPHLKTAPSAIMKLIGRESDQPQNDSHSHEPVNQLLSVIDAVADAGDMATAGKLSELLPATARACCGVTANETLADRRSE